MGILAGMPDLTSIKVSPEVRDRLAHAARIRGVTVRTLLDEVSRTVEDAALMDLVRRQMEELREHDPAEWQSYLDEGREIEEGMNDPIVD